MTAKRTNNKLNRVRHEKIFIKITEKILRIREG